jgi:predicted RNA-binding protein
MAPDFHPWRRNVRFVSVNEATIQPLIPELSFITNKTHWGFMFRFGLFEIPKADFAAIVAAMNYDVAQL